ncbi:MAG: molybdopterin-dependent oxidoreductase [Nocardioidaceae bacterium]
MPDAQDPLTATHWGNYRARVRDGRVLDLRPVAGDDEPAGIGAGVADTLRAPSRITEPMVRESWLRDGPASADGRRGSDRFVAVSWDVALDLVAEELDRVRTHHGNEAIYAGSYGWASAGRFHHAPGQLHRFLRCAGGYTDSQNSYSLGALEVILPHVIGGGVWSIWERCPTFEEIRDDGELVVCFGGMARKNTQANSGGVARHLTGGLQRECRERGVEFVNVSPLRDDVSADLEPQWLAPRPGTDVALMLALAYEIVSRDRHDRDFLERCCVGFDRFERYLRGASDGVRKDAAWAESITQLPRAEIEALAYRIATRRTVINVSWSLQRMDHGEQAHWMGVTLSALSGSLGRPGGGFAAGLGTSLIGVRRRRPVVASLPQGVNSVTGSIPVARVADMLLAPGSTYAYNGDNHTYPDIRLVYWAGGNPFHHHQDLNRLVRAWQRPETVVCHEAWWNPLARFSDVVFPIATSLERSDFAAGTMDLTLTPMERVVAPPEGVRTDYEVFAGLARRLSLGDAFTEGRDADAWVRELYERTRRSLAESGVDIGSYEEFRAVGEVRVPEPEGEIAGDFAALRRDPGRYPLGTPSGRIEIFSETVDRFGYDDCPGHPVWREPYEWLGSPRTKAFPLQLLSNQPATRLHSQYDNGAHSRAAKVNGREPVRLNPADAADRDIADGDVVLLRNGRGACLAGAVLDDAVRRGVVVLATGAWFDPGAAGEPERHGNPNVLTADRGTSRLAQGPSPGSTLVEIDRYHGDPPPVRAFEPPEVVRPGAAS